LLAAIAARTTLVILAAEARDVTRLASIVVLLVNRIKFVGTILETGGIHQHSRVGTGCALISVSCTRLTCLVAMFTEIGITLINEVALCCTSFQTDS